MKKVLITGAGGLLGFHCHAALFSHNCALGFQGKPAGYEITTVSKRQFLSSSHLAKMLRGCDIVFHLAGINRADDVELEQGNQVIAEKLISSMRQSGVSPHVIYANSTHSTRDSPYGRGKARAGEQLAAWAESGTGKLTNVVFPHIFGESSKPHYNTVTATLCSQIVEGVEPSISPGGEVELLHAGVAADRMVGFAKDSVEGLIRVTGELLSVQELYEHLLSFKRCYDVGVLPDLSDSLDLALFNTYRWFEYPQSFPRRLTVYEDPRGTLFEAVKGGGGGQTFLSWTEPGVERGNHFHLYKMERFLVVSGTADISIRRVFDEKIQTFSVSGSELEVVDIPTLHTHSIVNTGEKPLLTLFWAHEIFDPKNPDTYAHPVKVC